MTELSEYWAEYKKIQQQGRRTTRAEKLEELIHGVQKKLGSDAYDFDVSWTRIEKQSSPSIAGPPMEKIPDKIAPQKNFTFEEAEEIIGKNDCAILRDCARKAEANMVFLAKVLDEMNPLNTNVARRGQATNIAMTIFNKKKEENA